MTKGDRIRNRRIELNLTQDEMAKKLKTTKQTISKYEKNIVTNIPSDRLESIAAVLETTPAYIMGWDQEEIDCIANISNDADTYSDGHESLMIEISEMNLVPEDMKRIQRYAHMLQKADLRIIAEYFYKVYELKLTASEIKEVYEYAQYVKSKRNQ